jgi:hypothetical protein
MAKAVVMQLVALALALAVVAGMAADCNIAQLVVCKEAVMDGSKPTAACCSVLRAQEPCFCEYLKDPKFSKYVNNPNARTTVRD